jgi:predicted nuclease of predicted toxin-antitoxin system
MAGEAMAHVKRSTLADSVVMASAARSGSVVLTSDFEDLERLRAHFPSVRVLEV